MISNLLYLNLNFLYKVKDKIIYYKLIYNFPSNDEFFKDQYLKYTLMYKVTKTFFKILCVNQITY